jgi:hypothetical protein
MAPVQIARGMGLMSTRSGARRAQDRCHGRYVAAMAADPIFVGGTGNSGTTVVGRMLGHHPHYALVPVELKFHADPSGVPGVLAGRVAPDELAQALRSRWFRYRHHSGTPRGLHLVVGEEELEAALAAFAEQWPGDLRAALERLVRAVAVAAAPDGSTRPSWVETSPRTVVFAPQLVELFPHARIVNMVRDGRDVAVSKMRQGLQVPDSFAALDWWARKILRGERQAARAGAGVLTVRLEDLVRDDREATYARLLGALGIEDAPAMRAFFDTRMPAQDAHIGRWRDEIGAAERARFDARYRALVAELRDQGVAGLS